VIGYFVADRRQETRGPAPPLNLLNERARLRDHAYQTSQLKKIRRPDAYFARPAQGPVSFGIHPDGSGPGGDSDPIGSAGYRGGLARWIRHGRGPVDPGPVVGVP
jgi:hypothetical protein